MDSDDLDRAAGPEELAAAVSAQRDALSHFHHGHGDEARVVREETYEGHRIRVVTTYEISVDDEPVTGHLLLTNEGTVHYHAIPNQEFASMIDLAKRIIEISPGLGRPGHDHAGRDHAGHDHGTEH